MNKLTAGVCCFAISALFAWVSASLASNAAAARARATTVGAYLMAQHASSDNGIAIIATVAAVLMLVVGLVCIIAGLRSRSAAPAIGTAL